MAASTREHVYRLILILVSVAGTLVLAEVGLRLFLALAEPSSLNPDEALRRSRRSGLKAQTSDISLKGLVQASGHKDVVYELKPGLRGTFLGQPLQVNAFGLRDRDYPPAKPEGTYRIIGLGDSVMFGWGVAQEEPFLEVLERRLDAGGGRKLEVLNFAVPGYNTAMEVATFEHRALAFDPDLVILHFVQNDLKLPHFLQQPPQLWTLRRWYLKDLVKTRLRLLASYREEQLLPHDLGSFSQEDRERARDRYRHMEGESGFLRSMARLAELTGFRSIEVVVVMMGDDGTPWSLARQAAEEHGFELLVMAPYFSAYLTAHGFAHDRQGWQEAFWLSSSDQHPNAATHELYAEALLGKLSEMGLGKTLPRPPKMPG